jgi:hypothetical protein
MSDLSPRPSGGLSRRQREDRAYKLTLGTGAGALLTVVAVVLAVLGVIDLGVVLLLALVTGGLGYGLKRTLSP